MPASAKSVQAFGSHWPAPGKLNLTLRIVGRRPDGYHLLQTVFQFIDRCDWLSFYPRSDGHIRRVNPLPGVPEEQDLTVRAACLLQQAGGCKEGVEIEITKNLPMGGGLGGGSSDAATTLVALNRLWGLSFSKAELTAFGVELGADVPVFIGGRSAWAEGIGERLTPIDLRESWYVIVEPGCHVSTKDVFSAPDLTRSSEAITISEFHRGRQENDCVRVVRRLYPRVDAALAELSRFGPARLTGTGACVFLLCDQQSQAREIARVLAKRWSVFVAKGLNRSPLFDKAGG